MVSYKKQKGVYLFVQARMYRFQTPVRQTLICSNCRVLFYQLFLLCKHVNMNRTAAIFFRNVKTRVLDFCRRWPRFMDLDVYGYYVGQQNSEVKDFPLFQFGYN